jgi:predicted RNA-binding protein YlxR (DUF448 family)
MSQFHKPIRMCINCRVRFPQNELDRFQCKQGVLTQFKQNYGRSLYLCNKCQEERVKNVVKRLIKICNKHKNQEGNFSIKIKEFLFNVKQS